MTHLQTFFNIKNNFLQKVVSLNILGGINSWLHADEFVSTTDCQLLAVLWFAFNFMQTVWLAAAKMTSKHGFT